MAKQMDEQIRNGADQAAKSNEQKQKESKGQNIEPQAEEWNTQQPPNRDQKSPN